jgi:hypothetical protein
VCGSAVGWSPALSVRAALAGQADGGQVSQPGCRSAPALPGCRILAAAEACSAVPGRPALAPPSARRRLDGVTGGGGDCSQGARLWARRPGPPGPRVMTR